MPDSSPELSPVVEASGVKTFLDNFTAIAGSLTLAILFMSVSHEYGYFWSVGRQYQAFLTTTDYLANGVLWLPLAFAFAYQWADWSKSSPPSLGWKSPSVLIFGFIFIITVASVTWPLDYRAAPLLALLLALAWLRIWRRLLPRAALQEPSKFVVTKLLGVGVPVLAGMFLWGSVDAGYDLASFDEPYAFHFKNEDGTQLRIFLRNLDKGVLLRNAIDNTIEFRKWDDIVSISRRIPYKAGPLVCSLFGWFCGSRNIAGPL
jgi:hypothetical protein